MFAPPHKTMNREWEEYAQAYPEKAKWMLSTIEDIKMHPICQAQFPEAVCDYVTAGFKLEAKRAGIKLRSQGCKVGNTKHFILYDPEADRFFDWTAHQFPSLEIKTNPEVIVATKAKLVSLGYHSFKSSKAAIKVLRRARIEYEEATSQNSSATDFQASKK